jgi:hypothetical protein
VLPLQHPLGHELALHTHAPELHACFAAQAAQVAPAVPHEEADSPE